MAVAITYGSQGTAVSSAGSATVAGLAFNTATSDRLIAACITFEINTGDNPTITGVTIGGVTATHRATAATAGVNGARSSIWVAAVPTGTSGDVVVTLGSATAANPMSVSTHSITGADETPTDSDTVASNSAASVAISALTIPSDGAGLCTFANVTSGTATVWTGAASSHDVASGGTFTFRHSSAIVTTVGTNTITADAATAAQALVGVAWGPASGGAATSLPPPMPDPLPPATFAAQAWQSQQYVVQSFIFTAAYVPPPSASLLWQAPSVMFPVQQWQPPMPAQAFIGSNGGPPLVTPSLVYRPTFFDHMIIR